MRRLGSLFTGCRGLDLGLEAAGLELAWCCENDRACRNVIARTAPGVPLFGHVGDVDWRQVEPVDVLAGGFPCQDVSAAGRRAGLAYGTRSGLWFEFLRAIRVLRPRVVVVENVAGLLTRGFGLVMAGLAEVGYDASWASFRAADVGAPHGRERIFLVAADAERRELQRRRECRELARPSGEEPRARGERERDGDAATDRDRATADAGRERFDRTGVRDAGGAAGAAEDGRPGAPRPTKAAADADGRRREGGREPEPRRLESAPRRLADGRGPVRELDDAAQVDWGAYEAAIRQWERIFGRPAPEPVDARGRLRPEFVEWMLGFPDGWTDGVARTQRLKMLGNAVQVQCAELVGIAVVELLAAR